MLVKKFWYTQIFSEEHNFIMKLYRFYLPSFGKQGRCDEKFANTI